MPAQKRELYKAAEVCELAQLQPYVLRSWEAEFPGLGQVSGAGARVYRRADLDFVLRIKQLVFGEGLTLAGARRRLEEEAESDAPLALDDAVSDVGLPAEARQQLREIRRGLEGILALLGGARPAVPELELVAPTVAAPRARPGNGENSERSASGPAQSRRRRVPA